MMRTWYANSCPNGWARHPTVGMQFGCALRLSQQSDEQHTSMVRIPNLDTPVGFFAPVSRITLGPCKGAIRQPRGVALYRGIYHE